MWENQIAGTTEFDNSFRIEASEEDNKENEEDEGNVIEIMFVQNKLNRDVWEVFSRIQEFTRIHRFNKRRFTFQNQRKLKN